MPSPVELLIFLVIVLLLFGATRLPKLARSLGQSGKELRDGLRGEDDISGPCPYCGKDIPTGARFCPSCGKEVGALREPPGRASPAR